MAWVFSGALDARGNMEMVPEGAVARKYIAEPTRGEIARYGGGLTRRDLLKYAVRGAATAGAAAGLGVLYACGGNGNGNGNSGCVPTPTSPTCNEQYPGDITLFREMCLGINSPYSFGEAPINDGKSVRFREGIRPHMIIVRNSNLVDAQATYDAIVESSSAFSEFTGGVLTPDGEPEFVNFKPDPSRLQEGSVVYYFEGIGFVTFTNKLGSTLLRSWVRTSDSGRITNYNGVVNSFRHENGHAMALDHVNNQSALMRATSLAGHDGNVTEEEKTAANWKYTHPAGYSI